MHSPIVIENDQNTTSDLGIHGLHFSPNRVVESASHERTRVVSNTGYIVGHFVTHAPSFQYGNTIGLHLGQVDHLTFVSTEPKQITGTFIDCRAGSATLGERIVLRFESSLGRKLVIPAGVAHTFKNIGGVVTRNDLRLLCSATSERWRFEDDLVSMPLDITRDAVVPVDVNTLPLPRAAALLFYRLQRDLLVGGRDRNERRLEPSEAAEGTNVASVEFSLRPVSIPDGKLGVRFEPNSMFPVAQDSWGLVPSTSSCITELVTMRGLTALADYTVHARYDVQYTFLDRPHDEICLEVVDLRGSSDTFGATASFSFPCSERFRVVIPAGIAYRYRGTGLFTVRLEAELLVRGDEMQLPSLEEDSQFLRAGESMPVVHPPPHLAPPEVLHSITEFC